jgi:hypothetical protein
MTALDVRSRLVSLRAQRALILTATPSPEKDALAELDERIELAGMAYTGLALTEIATLRGELFGRQQG